MDVFTVQDVRPGRSVPYDKITGIALEFWNNKLLAVCNLDGILVKVNQIKKYANSAKWFSIHHEKQGPAALAIMDHSHHHNYPYSDAGL